MSSPHLTWTTARVYAVPVGLRGPQQSLNKVPKRLLMQVHTFIFLCFEMGKEHKFVTMLIHAKTRSSTIFR